MHSKQMTRWALAALLCTGMAGQAGAAITTLTGDTTFAPNFLRPGDYSGDTPDFITGVHYQAFDVTADVSDWQYTFITSCDFNCVSFFYNGAFDPSQPHRNLIESDANDGYNLTVLMRDMDPGRHYTYVVAGYYDYDWGAFSTTVGGDGLVTLTPVPEPTSGALMLGGLATLGLLGRRRRALAR
jgi:PEP-CTERM motif